jgi:excisionase family DNA binding protein
MEPSADKTGLRADGLDELLTPDDVAALLQVPKSWVYERTRRRGPQRLPFVKLGKYVRFEVEAVRAFLARQRKSQ